jgi:transcription antitermination factor NusG
MVHDPNTSWFALRVKPNCEKVVSQSLQGKGYEEFLPVYRSRRRRCDRFKNIEVPLFPGYLFCRFNPMYRLPILTIPGMMHVVGIGATPIPISDQEIDSLKTVVDSQLRLQLWPFLQAGDAVRIEEGPLGGARGIVVDIKGTERLVVSISLLQRSVAVEIERGWLRPQFAGRVPSRDREGVVYGWEVSGAGAYSPTAH